MSSFDRRLGPFVLASGLTLAGCQSGAATMTIAVQSPADANQGRPLHMLVRTVDQGTFLGDSYQDAAAKVTAPDVSVVASNVVFPGTALDVQIARQDKSPLGVYFFFTKPANNSSWKTFIELPLPGQVQIQLQGNGVGQITSD